MKPEYIPPFDIPAITKLFATSLPREQGLQHLWPKSCAQGASYPKQMDRLKASVPPTYTGPTFSTALLSHDLFAHCAPPVTKLITEANHVSDQLASCPDCDAIPPNQRLKPTDDPAWTERPAFMESIGMVTLRSKLPEFVGHLQIVLVEQSTNCLFLKIVQPRDKFADEVVALLEKIRTATDRPTSESPSLATHHCSTPLTLTGAEFVVDKAAVGSTHTATSSACSTELLTATG